MVLSGEMTTATTRPETPTTTTLHNFSLPKLKWGTQRQFKCMKIDSGVSSGSDAADHRTRRRSPPRRFADSFLSSPFLFGESDNHGRSNGNNKHHRPRKSGEEEGIAELSVKLISDLKTEGEEIIKQSMFREEDDEGKEISPAKPWNLRKRRAPFKETVPTPVVKTVDPTPVVKETETTMRRKFSAKLTKKEIEEDYMEIVGRRPPRRPTKRPRNVQRTLDNLFPGLYLSEVTLEAYKVT